MDVSQGLSHTGTYIAAFFSFFSLGKLTWDFQILVTFMIYVDRLILEYNKREMLNCVTEKYKPAIYVLFVLLQAANGWILSGLMNLCK